MRLPLLAFFFFCTTLLYAQNPNIVFILGDDMNRDSWGIYGNPDCKTPNIDRIGADGLVFENLYASAAMCSPFRQELYSGRSPWRTGTLANHSKSIEGTKSLPHYLKPLGYRVALLGKSHIGPKQAYPFEYLKGDSKSKNANEKFLASSAQFIESAIEEKKPFCLFIASSDSHAPFTTGDRSAYSADELTVPPYWIDTPEMRQILVQYYAEVSNFDSLVGRVEKMLKDKNLWNNTIFIVCSEQGSQFPFSKWTCYNTGLHSGMIAHWPTSSTKTINQLLSISDIAPTLAEAAHYTTKENDFDGFSFLNAIKGDNKEIRPFVYGAFTNCNIIDNHERVYPIRVIRNKDYSFIYNANYQQITSNTTLSSALNIINKSKAKKKSKPDIASSWLALSKTDPQYASRVKQLYHRPQYELYNRRVDPYELQNQISNPEYASIIKQLKSALEQQLYQLGDSDPIATEKSLIKHKNKKRK
ncbi:sulfatase [Lentisphaera profundi]|uniref:Sulfatase n=1 Tax=Lentisphaera profundi TaxID=1658616 RepID=A0ABY7VNE4_9BACT|nr:sulfatase [Lentisphaera profundi]WDE95417.1 sulfatase [Lentisphaera profundi]